MENESVCSMNTRVLIISVVPQEAIIIHNMAV